MADASAENQEILSEIACEINENKTEPSTPFVSNLDKLYRAPKQDVINNLGKHLDSKVINTLRDQLFFVFLDTFKEETLSKNGFSKAIVSENPTSQLRRRMKASTALNDVYAIGLCIAEKDIITGLSAEIMKQQTPPNSMHQDVHFQNVIDSNSKQILEKLNTITNMMKTVVKENKGLKGHIVNLEKKLDYHLATECQLSTPQPTHLIPILSTPKSTLPPPLPSQ